MRRRTAATLIEVLVAIFVMSIGLLALLTLFPLGALTMAQAIKDARTAQAAANAEAIAAVRGFRNDPLLVAPGGGQDQFVDPNLLDTPPAEKVLPAPGDGPSYPIYVDPIGTQAFLPGFSRWVGGRPLGANQPGIPRRSVSFPPPPPLVQPLTLRWFTLLDDFTFDAQGGTGGASVPAREGRYSWAYLLRRPRSSVPSIVDLTVVVYSQRSLNLTPGLVPAGETAYAAEVPAGMTNVIALKPAPGEEKPAVRKGDWILDASITPDDPAQLRVHGRVHGYFYRVVGVTDVGGTVELELQTSLRAYPNGVPYPVTRVIVMEGVAEVFDKGPGSLP